MPEAKLTKAEVKQALDDFRRSGLPRPGLHRLRAQIGHGSLARLRRLIHEIEEDEVGRLVPGGRVQLPDPISAKAAELWAELEAAFTARERQLEAELAAELANKQAALEAAAGERDRLAETVNRLQVELRDARALQVQQQARVAELEKTAAERQAQLGAQGALLTALREREADLKASLVQSGQETAAREQDLKRAVAHAHEQAAEARAQTARERQAYEAQLAALRDTLAGYRESTQRTLVRLEESERVLKEQVAKQAKTIEALNAQLAASEADMERVRKDLQETAQRLTQYEAALGAKDVQISALESERDALHARLSESTRQHEKLVAQLEARLSERAAQPQRQ